MVAFVSDRTEDFRSPTPYTRRPDPTQPTVIPATPQELLSEFEGWGSDVLGLLSCVQKTDKWLINVLHPELRSYTKGRVALLGDAVIESMQHSMMMTANLIVPLGSCNAASSWSWCRTGNRRRVPAIETVESPADNTRQHRSACFARDRYLPVQTVIFFVGRTTRV